MGQKVSPIGFRLGINKNWESRWFPNPRTMAENIGEDDIITLLSICFTFL